MNADEIKKYCLVKLFLRLELRSYKQRKGFSYRFRSFPKVDPGTAESAAARK